VQYAKVLSLAALVGAVTLAGSPAFAQTAPAPAASPAPPQRGTPGMRGMTPGMRRPAPDMSRMAPETIRRAYGEIGRAQAANSGSGYLGSAKAHYTAALARLAKNDAAGAVGEAHAASAYAHLAMGERGPSVPSGIAAPPARPTDANMEASRAYAMLGRLAKAGPAMTKVAGIAGTDEAKRLLAAAVGAQSAAERAVNAKNYPDAAKQTRLASELGHALVAVAMIDHAADVRAALPPGWGMMHHRPGMHGPGGMPGMRPGMPGGMGMPGRAGMLPGPGGPDEAPDADDDGMPPPAVAR
jgi:hypothetical protein